MQLDKKNKRKASELERRVKVTTCFIASSPRSITLAPGGLGGHFGPAHCHSQSCFWTPQQHGEWSRGLGGMESGEGGSPTFSTLLASKCFFVGFLCLKGCRGSGGWVAFFERTDVLSKDRKAEGCG